MTETKDFQKLFYSLYPSLCRQANKYIANQAICEDIVQECFIKYWENHERGVHIENPSFYLITSIRNSCISYLRKTHIEYDVEDTRLQASHNFDFIETDNEKSNDLPDEMEIINQALSLLPIKCRQIFEQSKIHGKSYKEIADSFDISIKTVENQMGKALKIMRQFIKDHPQYFSVIIAVFYNFIQK